MNDCLVSVSSTDVGRSKACIRLNMLCCQDWALFLVLKLLLDSTLPKGTPLGFYIICRRKPHQDSETFLIACQCTQQLGVRTTVFASVLRSRPMPGFITLSSHGDGCFPLDSRILYLRRRPGFEEEPLSILVIKQLSSPKIKGKGEETETRIILAHSLGVQGRGGGRLGCRSEALVASADGKQREVKAGAQPTGFSFSLEVQPREWHHHAPVSLSPLG